MKEQISELTNIDKSIIDDLFKKGLIDPRSAAKFLLVEEYKTIKALNPELSNSMIYFDLSEKHKVSESTVYKWVNSYF